jgi:D-cysteine desulfhydrase
MTERVHLAHLPTPLVSGERIARALGWSSTTSLWIKRDDISGGPEAGNKVRKLEYLLADALRTDATTLVTCGGIQSNHARATAIVGARFGLRSVLLLRTTEQEFDIQKVPLTGNLFLDRLVGAEVRLITPAQYRERNALMQSVAEQLRERGERPYVIPEGGSNGLGSLGYVHAMREVRSQLDLGLAGTSRFDIVAHACGSGGTAAGVALGARAFDVADEVMPFAVCDDKATFEASIARIIADAQSHARSLTEAARLRVLDEAKGPAYAVASEEQRALIIRVARASGFLFDPVYTGKALFGLDLLAKRGELDGKRVLFLHTGGLPGLLADASAFDLSR